MRQHSFAPVMHHIDLITLFYEYSRSVWRHLPFHIIGQVLVATLTSYSLLWGRNRIFETINVDPELVSECILKEIQNEDSRWNIRLMNWFKTLSMFKKEIGNEPFKGLNDKESWKL